MLVGVIRELELQSGKRGSWTSFGKPSMEVRMNFEQGKSFGGQ